VGLYNVELIDYRLSVNEEDMEDKLWPSIQYLQKLGSEYTDLVFNYSKWMFDVDSEMAFQVLLLFMILSILSIS